MYYSKDEMIELNNGKKYLVLDTVMLDENVYYKLKEVNGSEDGLIGDFIYVTTLNKEGKIYINEDISSEELEKIKILFES